MTLRNKTLSVLVVAFVLSIVAVACGESTVNIIATNAKENQIENTAVARQATIDAGGDPDAGGGITTGEGSIASQQATRTAATSTALAGATPTPTATPVIIEVPVDGPTLTDADNPVVQIGELGEFTPDIIKVKVGTTVTWENPRRSASSTASTEDASDPTKEQWNSDSMSKGTFDREPARFSWTFTKLGCHQYASLYSGDIGTGAVCVVE